MAEKRQYLLRKARGSPVQGLSELPLGELEQLFLLWAEQGKPMQRYGRRS